MRMSGRQIRGAAVLAALLVFAATPSERAGAEPSRAAAPERSASAEDPWDLQSRLSQLNERRQRERERRPSRPRETAAGEPSDPSASSDPAKLRAAVIDAHRPAPEPAPEWLPRNLAVAMHMRLGGLLEWMGQSGPALDAYARAIAADSEDLESWRALGRMRVREGDLDGAEAAFLAALERSDEAAQREQIVSVHRDLGEIYLLLRRPRDARAALEPALHLDPDSMRVLKLLTRALHEMSPDTEPPPSSPVPLFPETDADRTRAGWESAFTSIFGVLPSFAQSGLVGLQRWALTDTGFWVLLGTLGVAFGGWLAARRFKGRGDLVVTLAYPPELAGSFSVRLSSQPGRFKRTPRAAKGAITNNRASTRTDRYAISRETQFQGVRAQTWYATVEGLLHDPASAEIVTDPFDEQAVQVLAGQTVHLDFDVGPRESAVDVRATWDKRPARDAAVAARGFPQSLRYAREGSTRLRLGKGLHKVMVGSGDRVAEVEVEVESFRTTLVEIDLGNTEHLIFKGCPPAVEPYLHGDLSAAARALERDGHSRLANLLLATLHREQGRADRAAQHFESAGRAVEAAELYAEVCKHEAAARLFEEGGAHARAGDMLRLSGDLLRAGESYERADDFDNAVECYKEAGEHARWIDAVERSGAVFAAAKLAVEHGDRGRTIRLLQQVQPDHTHYGEASEMLAQAYLQEGHRDLAARKLEERLSSSEAGETAPELHWQLADLLEHEGDFAKALDVLTDLREREPTYPNIATRIELLRKKQSERELVDSRGGPTSSLAPTAFLAERRYHIQGELGRGGMGVVLAAQDTRLQRIVALKRLPETLRDHPKAIALFLREAQSAARLNHPNIVTVYDTDQEDGVFFITMELLEGHPVSKILKKRGRISPRNVAQLGAQITAGLEYAHRKGIVHRDIKSANLFFTVDKVVKIMDFGLAKMMEEVRRGTTVIGGTPYYMAPEQAAGSAVDHRADLYALGVTFFELLTGRVPYHEGDVAYHHRHSPIPDPRASVPDIPEAWACLVMDLMQKSADDRPASAAMVAKRLEALVA